MTKDEIHQSLLAEFFMRKVLINAEDDKFLILVNLTFDFPAQLRDTGDKTSILCEIKGGGGD